MALENGTSVTLHPEYSRLIWERYWVPIWDSMSFCQEPERLRWECHSLLWTLRPLGTWLRNVTWSLEAMITWIVASLSARIFYQFKKKKTPLWNEPGQDSSKMVMFWSARSFNPSEFSSFLLNNPSGNQPCHGKKCPISNLDPTISTWCSLEKTIPPCRLLIHFLINLR